MEQLVELRLRKFLDKHNALYEGQYGFRKRRSCYDAILDLIGNITESLDNKQMTLAVFLNMSKAFDTIEHPLLLQKLENYTIRGLTLQWFESYLSQRKLLVEIDNTQSELFNVEYGTVQGSVLGPIFYILFTNDLRKYLKFSSCVCFADDTTLYLRGYNVRCMVIKMWEDLIDLARYFKDHCLTLNLSKMSCILFTNKSEVPSVDL